MLGPVHQVCGAAVDSIVKEDRRHMHMQCTKSIVPARVCACGMSLGRSDENTFSSDRT